MFGKKFFSAVIITLLVMTTGFAQQYEAEQRPGELGLGAAGVGPATFSNNVQSDRQAYNVYGGYVFELSPYAALKGIVDATSDFDNAILTSANLGGNLYLFNRDVSPYIGGEVGLSLLREFEQDSNEWGLGAGLSVGAQVFRFGTTQINIELGTKFNFNDFDDEDAYMYTSRVGILF